MLSLEFKYGFDDGGNTNSARKGWHDKQYTQQRLNRGHKPQESIHKLKEAEFWYMLQGKLYRGAQLLQKKSKI